MSSNEIVLPTYVCKLPSSGQQITFRPFTVKEEKSLLLAIEENNILTVAETLKKIINACTSEAVNAATLPYYDSEYLFLQIRSKAVGEVIDLVGTCTCGGKTQFDVDIATAKVEPKPSGNLTTKIADTKYTIVLRHPSLIEYAIAYDSPEASGTDTVANCIQSVYTDDEVFDWSLSEKKNFIESMSPKQQKEIIKFLDGMPQVLLDSSFKCRHCNKHNEKTLTGFENFFV